MLLVVEKTFGGEHPRVAMSLETLAQLMHDQVSKLLLLIAKPYSIRKLHLGKA